VLAKVPEFGGSVVEEAVSEAMGIIRDPDGQMIELVTDGWLAALPPRP
jgi:lactoylglutathione lyase